MVNLAVALINVNANGIATLSLPAATISVEWQLLFEVRYTILNMSQGHTCRLRPAHLAYRLGLDHCHTSRPNTL